MKYIANVTLANDLFEIKFRNLENKTAIIRGALFLITFFTVTIE